MESILPILKYLGTNAGMILVAMFYSWAVQNMQPIQREESKIEKLPLVIVLSLLITPFGAWIVSVFMKSRRVIQDIKKLD
jgi:hypothetical protein